MGRRQRRAWGPRPSQTPAPQHRQHAQEQTREATLKALANAGIENAARAKAEEVLTATKTEATREALEEAAVARRECAEAEEAEWANAARAKELDDKEGALVEQTDYVEAAQEAGDARAEKFEADPAAARTQADAAARAFEAQRAANAALQDQFTTASEAGGDA